MFPIIEVEDQIEYTKVPDLSFVPDFYSRYPGEIVHFFTRVLFKKEYINSILSIALPLGLELIEFSINENETGDTYVKDQQAAQVVDWHLGKKYLPGQFLELTIKAKVLNQVRKVYLVSVADLINSKGQIVASENIRVAVHPKGSYLNHLPEIYHDQDFIGRYLMLFESFWKPINQQINQIDLYFDPAFTPSEFLPWLGSWLGVVWDENLPEERKRNLLQVAVQMYQRRGTKSSMEDYLSIYTNGQVEIIEHRSQNFQLGNEAKLGRAIALGSQNLPHTFTVNVKVDEEEINRMDARDRSRNENAYIQRITQLIEDRKPAHTAFKLNLEVMETLRNELLEGEDAK